MLSIVFGHSYIFLWLVVNIWPFHFQDLLTPSRARGVARKTKDRKKSDTKIAGEAEVTPVEEEKNDVNVTVFFSVFFFKWILTRSQRPFKIIVPWNF